MSRASRSLFVFGIYVLIAGASFAAAPEMMMRVLSLPAATAGWARMVGLLALVIGAYYIVVSRAECMAYIRASVWVRLGFAAGAVLLVVSREMPPTVLGLAVADAAGAIWTAIAAKRPAIAGPHASI